MKRTYTSTYTQTTDVGFRAWIAELIAELIATGLIQTADAGQINTGTVVRPGGTFASAGYAMFKLPDSSLFIKLEFGVGGTIANPHMWVTVGEGSDGNGNLTGAQSTRTTWASNNGPSSSSTPYTSYLCVLDHALAIHWKGLSQNGSVDAGAMLVIGKSVNGLGQPTNHAYGVAFCFGGVLRFQAVRRAANPVTLPPSPCFSMVVGGGPGGITASVRQDGKPQAYHWLMNVPEVLPFAWGATVLAGESIAYSETTAAMVGGVERNYLVCGSNNVNPNVVNTPACRPLMIWE